MRQHEAKPNKHAMDRRALDSVHPITPARMDETRQMMDNQPIMDEQAPSAEALALADIRFGYTSGQPIIEHFTAQVQQGQVIALIGPNAVGKSTLLRLMMGQLTPWTGTIALCGKPIGKFSAADRAAWLSYVPQRAAASFAYTVREVVEMGRFALSPDPSAVQQALEVCDLFKLAETVYAMLSVGQQQRVMLARAIAQSQGRGKIMLLDEPGSAMDLWHTHHTMLLLRKLAADSPQKMGVVVVLHDLNLAARYADAVWLMHEGRLIAQGPWQDVLRPEILDPVYGVKLTPLSVPERTRPIFDVTFEDPA